MAENKNLNTSSSSGSDGYQMKTNLGVIAMLISATGMGLVPLFSRWATRTDMFDGTLGLNGSDSIGRLWRAVVWVWALSSFWCCW